MEDNWQFPKKLNIELAHDSAIPFLGIHPKELKGKTQTGTCTPSVMVALLKTAPKGETT